MESKRSNKFWHNKLYVSSSTVLVLLYFMVHVHLNVKKSSRDPARNMPSTEIPHKKMFVKIYKIFVNNFSYLYCTNIFSRDMFLNA